MSQANTPTFAPKRAPWFKGVFAVLIVTLLAYAVMIAVETQPAAGQSSIANSGYQQ